MPRGTDGIKWIGLRHTGYSPYPIDNQEWYRKQCKPISPLLTEQETAKMNIQEKDCRRCEKLNEEGKCIAEEGNFTPNVEAACGDFFTPITGRDCRNCERFNGQGQDCATGVGRPGQAANNLENACINFNPLSTSKSSPTVLVYTDEEDSKFRITKGDKTLSLENIWKYKPCSDIYNRMVLRFINKGFNIDTEISFTQENLDLLTDPAFHWLLEEDFLIKAKEEKPVYGIGQWFRMRSDHRNLYVLCEGREPQCVLLIRVFGNAKPTQCSPGRWNTIKEAGAAVGHTSWKELEPIDPPVIRS